MTQVSGEHAGTRRGAPFRSLRSRRGRLKLAGALAAFAVAGLYASSQAAAQVPGVSLGASAGSSCGAGQVRWGYEVGLVPGADRGFSIEGIRIDAVPDGCTGTPVAVTYLSGTKVVRQAVRLLTVGVVDRIDRAAVGDVVVTSASWAPAR